MHREDLQGDLLFSIPGFFSAEECRRAIAFSEGLGYADAPLTTALGVVMNKEVRNNTRVMVDVPRVAAEVFERARPFLPARVDRWQLHGMNERFRYYRYRPRQYFDSVWRSATNVTKSLPAPSRSFCASFWHALA